MSQAYNISVAIPTWPRFDSRLECLKTTVAQLKKNLVLGPHRWRWVCSAETAGYSAASRALYDELERFATAENIELYYRGGTPSIGSNNNQLFGLTDGDYVLYWQDDWFLMSPLDVTPDCAILDAELLSRKDYSNSVCAVRYGPFPVVPNGAWVVGEYEGYLLLDNSVDRQWYHSDHPHLRAPRMHWVTGYYEERPFAEDEINMATVVANSGMMILGRPHQIFHTGAESTCTPLEV